MIPAGNILHNLLSFKTPQLTNFNYRFFLDLAQIFRPLCWISYLKNCPHSQPTLNEKYGNDKSNGNEVIALIKNSSLNTTFNNLSKLSTFVASFTSLKE